MVNMDCKMKCHYCGEVFIVASLTTPLPEHKHGNKTCPGSGKEGNLLSIHQKKRTC